MKTVCQPLFKLGIDYFSHVHLNANEITANGSNPDFFRYYFEYGFQQSDLHTAKFEIPQRYVLWHVVERQGKAEELFRVGMEFGLFYVFTIIEHGINEKNYYHFAAGENKEYMNEFYFRHIDLLEQFIAWYQYSLVLNDRLKRAYSMPYKIEDTAGKHIIRLDRLSNLSPEGINDFLNSIQQGRSSQTAMAENLCRRELQCALYLLEGKTTMEIAQLLHLSPRTVEVYFDRLKKRFGSKNKIQLTRHLIESSLLEWHSFAM